MPSVIYREGDAGAGFISYQLGAKEQFRLLAAAWAIDGTPVNANYYPSFFVNAANGNELFAFGSDVEVTQHASVYVSMAPYLIPTASPVPVTATIIQASMPDLEYAPGMKIQVGGRTIGDFNFDFSLVISYMSLYVEGLHVGTGEFAAGPFMLVPGPGA